MTTVLQELVEKAVATAVATSYVRWAEKMGEEMAREVMKDKVFKARMIALARTAFEKALIKLGEAHPGDPTHAPLTDPGEQTQ
jgi:hypothetical protein